MNLDDIDFADILTKAAGAVIILVITWILARVVKTLLTRALGKVKALQGGDGSGQSVGASLGSIAALVIWLFGLIAVLNLFDLTQVVTPIQNLLDGALAALPGIIGAGILFVIGLVLARIARELVETALRTAGADRVMGKLQSGNTTATPAHAAAVGGTATATGSDDGPKLSKIAGQLVFVIVLVVVSISAIQVLGIAAISEPATEMLTLILNAIPAILAAAILLGIGYLVARIVAPVLESTLAGLGVDNALAGLSGSGEQAGAATTASSRKPSALIASIAQVAIMLFFAIAATRVLGFSEITEILDTVLAIGGSVLLGAAIIAAGVFIANLLPRFVSGTAGQIIRFATMALFVAIGLGSMGLAESIVNLAFGAIVIGAAAAAAVAFGLGGRDAAARELAEWQDRRASRTDAPTPH